MAERRVTFRLEPAQPGRPLRRADHLGHAARDQPSAPRQSGFFDSVWVGDNLLSKPRLEAIVALSALAARTRRVKLGTICLASFPLRHPLLLAIQWASLDLVSGGRTILAVCIGGSARKGPQFAAELAADGRRLRRARAAPGGGDRAAAPLLGRRTGRPSRAVLQFENVEALPKPAQTHLPIVIAVNPTAPGRPRRRGARPAPRRPPRRRLADRRHPARTSSGSAGTASASTPREKAGPTR